MLVCCKLNGEITLNKMSFLFCPHLQSFISNGLEKINHGWRMKFLFLIIKKGVVLWVLARVRYLGDCGHCSHHQTWTHESRLQPEAKDYMRETQQRVKTHDWMTLVEEEASLNRFTELQFGSKDPCVCSNVVRNLRKRPFHEIKTQINFTFLAWQKQF